MKLRAKMTLSMAVVFILFTIASGLSLFGIYQSQVKFERFLATDVALLEAESEMYAQGLQMGQALRNVILAPANKTGFKNHEKAAKDFNDAMAKAISLAGYDPETLAVLKDIAELRKKQEPIQANIIALALEDRTQAIEAVNKGETPLWRDIKAKLLDLIKKRQDSVQTAKAATLEFTNQSLMLSSALIVAAIIFGIFVSAWLIRSITRPLEYAVSIAKTTAACDLSSDIEVTSNDEAGQLMQALKDMTENLLRMVSEVRAGTHQIAAASVEIADGNANLAARTEAQADSVEGTVATMEKITANVRMNAENAKEANDLAVSASNVAVKGGEVVAEVVDTMSAISEASQKIFDIISIIDGIAFQTNILALNAAVEAARAGEQGRGFAVVATEVRSLAQRSAGAAREIKELINNSVEKVSQGSKLVEQAGSTMRDVVDSIERVHSIMSDITVSSQQQSAGIEEVSNAISQIDEMTQQNASLVEQVTAVAESLRDRGANLDEMVSVFRLRENVAAQPSRGKPRRLK